MCASKLNPDPGTGIASTEIGSPGVARVPVTPLSRAVAVSLDEATRALDFSRPLSDDDERWVDLSPARGDHARSMIAKKLRRKEPGRFCHLAFVSHRGAGKTTELLRLQKDLAGEFLSLYFVANVEMDAQRIDTEDLLLVLAQGVEELLREQGLPLDAELMQRIASWFSEVTDIDKWLEKSQLQVSAGAELKAEVPFLAKLLVGFKSLLKVESEKRTEVKRVLRQYPGTLLKAVNDLLDDAHQRLQKAGRGELLVVIDNLDRYHPDAMDDLLVKGGDTLRQLQCNLLVTPPILLQYKPKTALLNQYFDVEVLHAPRVRRKDQPFTHFDGPGFELLQEVLAKRIDLSLLLPDPAARSRLIGATGGALRELLRYAQEASLLSDTAPMTLDHVERVVRKARAALRDLINANGWHEPLATILKTKQLTPHPACLDLLHHRLVLKYNGETWYDVHPLVAEIEEIQEIVRREAVSGATSDAAHGSKEA